MRRSNRGELSKRGITIIVIDFEKPANGNARASDLFVFAFFTRQTLMDVSSILLGKKTKREQKWQKIRSKGDQKARFLPPTMDAI